MPGFTTHYILGMKAYNNMPSGQLKFVIAKYRWLYQLGLQGPDMFFYNLPILRHRDYRNVGSWLIFAVILATISAITPAILLFTDGLAMMSATLLPTTTVSTRFWKMTLTPSSSTNTSTNCHPSLIRRPPSV